MSVSPFEFLVLVLASWRASRFLALDSLTESMRDELEAWAHRRQLPVDPERAARESGIPRALRITGVTETVYGPRRFWRGKLAELVSCPYCVSFWIACATYVIYVCVVGRWSDVPLLANAITAWGVAGAVAVIARYDVGGGKEERLVQAVEESVDE